MESLNKYTIDEYIELSFKAFEEKKGVTLTEEQKEILWAFSKQRLTQELEFAKMTGQAYYDPKS